MSPHTPWFAVVLLGLAAGAPWAQQANLLPNASFDKTGQGQVPAEWSSSCTGGSRADRDDTTAHTGPASGHIVKLADGESHVAALVYPKLPVTGGQHYTLSGWIKGETTHGRATLFLYQYDKDGKWLGGFFQNIMGQTAVDWTPVRRTQAVEPHCAWVQVRFEIFGKESLGQAWVDDVYFGQDTTPSGAVRDLRVTRQADTVVLGWQEPADGKPFGYEVYRAPYPRYSLDHPVAIGFTTRPSFEQKLPPGHAHYYAVVALDQALNASEPVFSEAVRPPTTADAPPFAAWLGGPAKRWGPDLPFPVPQQTRRLPIDMARGEYESAQVLVGAVGQALDQVSVAVGDIMGPQGGPAGALQAELLLQEYVPIPGGARWIPEPLPPPRPVSVAPGMMRGWWVLVHAARDAAAGQYRVPLKVAIGRQPPIELELQVELWPVTVPRENHYGGDWGIWGKQLAEQEGVQVGSPEYDKLMERYRDFFLAHRMVPRSLPGPVESDKSALYLADGRVSSFTIPTGNWAKLMDEGQAATFADRCHLLRDKGWLSKGHVYVYDEPVPEQYEQVAGLCVQVHEAGQDVRVLLTEQPEKPLYGHVDIWCPCLHIFADSIDECRKRQQQGDEVWWYVCLAPRAPWPNYNFDNDPIDGRVLSWLQVKHSIAGELYWSVTCFPGDVWAQGLPERCPGDGYLCYPGKPRGLEGPITCIRAEVIRDAKEDIELIWLLRQVAAEEAESTQAEKVIRAALDIVCAEFLEYAKHDEDIVRARRMILSEIVRLSG